MKRFIRDRRIIALLGAVVVVACSAATKEVTDRIAFSHHVHTEQELGCTDCHAALLQDLTVTDVQGIPGKPGCADCHDIDSKDNCAKCHSDSANPSTWARGEEQHLIFSHQSHADFGAACEDCHAGAAHWPDAKGEPREGPAHAQCSTCHEEDLDASRCKMCHIRLDLYPRKPESIYSHEEGFFQRHGVKAQGSEDICAQCHDQTFCADCHAGTMTVKPSLRYPERVDREFVHRGNFLARHALEARIGDTGCLKCHGNSFCSSCHERNGVGGALGRRNPHADQPNWVATSGASGHGRAARRQISECASCHDQGPASNCVHCHRTGGVDPHPPGWDPPVGRSERTKHKMCRICHTN